MIISHKHNFIFIKTEKTAGTSLEIALSKFCGESDIITPISPEDENYRKELGFRGAQNYLVPKNKLSKMDRLNSILGRRKFQFFNHMEAVRVKKYVDKNVWEDYYKFTFERNPYDKLISWYYWKGGEDKYNSIANFIKSGDAAKIRGFDLYALNNEIIVDDVYLYENLDASLEKISQKLGLDETLKMPEKKLKGGIRKTKQHYSEMLNKDDKEWVRKVFAREFANFNYTIE